MASIKVIIRDGAVEAVLQDCDEPIGIEIIDCNDNYGFMGIDYVQSIYKNKRYKLVSYTITPVDTTLGDTEEEDEDA